MTQESLWSEDDIKTLKSGWARGWTGVQLSLAVDKRHSRNGCIGKANRLKLAPRDNTINRGYQHRTSLPKPKPPQKPPEAPTEALPAVGPVEEMVSGNACKWPVSATGEPFQQCGHPREHHRPYCSFHCKQAYTPNHRPAQSGSFRSDRIR